MYFDVTLGWYRGFSTKKPSIKVNIIVWIPIRMDITCA